MFFVIKKYGDLILKLNRFMIVSIILLAIISIGAASAVSDDASNDNEVVGVTEELEISASDVDEIGATGEDIASGDNVIGASDSDEQLSAGSVNPNYQFEIKPAVMDGSNYVAQYGQIITVNGTIENGAGEVSIRFGYFYYKFILFENLERN